VDSGIRISDLYGQVAIKRKDAFDDGYEYCTLDTIIYEGDIIWTEVESGAVISLRDMSTFVIKPNTKIQMPETEDSPSAMEIWGGNILVNLKKMVEGGEFTIETQQVAAGARGRRQIKQLHR